MSLPKNLDTAKIEDKWYSYWTEHDFFKSQPDDREPYTIVIPPPNVTGMLHMGHMLNNTIQDVLIRRARMKGYNACWVPGTDHASIATEAKVVNLLKEKGLTKSQIGREAFLEHAYEWKEKYGGIILEQLKKLGASCDWSRTRFTMEPKLSDAVLKVFVQLHEKGLIYRGMRMTNWDPDAKTALSDEEVIYKEEQSHLYYIKYQLADENGKPMEGQFATIATTRPETLLGDTAICVHPDDERFRHLHGKNAIVPLVNRVVPIVCDEYVEMEFGTGVLKITPAHDPNDFMLGEKHKLEVIDILKDDGSLSEAAQFFVGEDRFKARKLTVKELKNQELLEKEEQIQNKVGYSERTNAVIEPRLTEQWFLDMKPLAKPALEEVMSDNVRFFPSKFKNTYKYWMENIKDWCISRQLWWGQRIPAYYYNKQKDYVVAETAEKALQLAREKSGNPNLKPEDLRQDEDVVDTWFSSWLWPISVFDGFDEEGKKELDYYYPGKVLVTGWDIMFFWVARMIMAGLEFKGEKPFEDVYFHGMVRDKLRRKMSKSLGNSPDPLELITNYGADGTRVGMLMSAPAGNDLLFDEKRCEQGRNFSNKLWNALRLMKSWEIDENIQTDNSIAIKWIEAKLNQTAIDIEKSFEQYRLFEAIMDLYNFVWDDFCSWYLEMIKPEFGQPIDRKTYEQTIEIFEKITQLLHPFMPFVSEEIWQNLKERADGKSLCVEQLFTTAQPDKKIIKAGDKVKKLITGTREIRTKLGLKQKEEIQSAILTENFEVYQLFESIIKKLANLAEFNQTDTEISGVPCFANDADRVFITSNVEMDTGEVKDKLLKEKEHLEKFIMSISKKLENKKFVDNAPEAVVNLERKKMDDNKAKLKAIEESLAGLAEV